MYYSLQKNRIKYIRGKTQNSHGKCTVVYYCTLIANLIVTVVNVNEEPLLTSELSAMKSGQ